VRVKFTRYGGLIEGYSIRKVLCDNDRVLLRPRDEILICPYEGEIEIVYGFRITSV